MQAKHVLPLLCTLMVIALLLILLFYNTENVYECVDWYINKCQSLHLKSLWYRYSNLSVIGTRPEPAFEWLWCLCCGIMSTILVFLVVKLEADPRRAVTNTNAVTLCSRCVCITAIALSTKHCLHSLFFSLLSLGALTCYAVSWIVTLIPCAARINLSLERECRQRLVCTYTMSAFSNLHRVEMWCYLRRLVTKLPLCTVL